MEKITIKTNVGNSYGSVLLGDMDISRFVKEIEVVSRVGSMTEVIATLIGEVELDSTVGYKAKYSGVYDPHNKGDRK